MDHLQAFNSAKFEAELCGEDSFTFRGKQYYKGTWGNGVPVWRGEAYRGSKKKRKSRRRKSKRSRKSRR